MRVLLVGPDFEENLSLRYLSGALQAAGHAAELVAFNGPEDRDAVVGAAEGFDLVGLSLCFQARVPEFLALARSLKARRPGLPIVVGGHYATCAAEQLMRQHLELDVLVLHEGEGPIVEIADRGADPARLHEVSGIWYRRGSEVLQTAQRRMVEDLDSLPWPDRSGPLYFNAGVPTAWILGSRGCVGSCDYCCISTLHRAVPGKRYRVRSVDDVVAEMASLYHGRGIRQFVFHDDNFLVPSEKRNHARLDAYEQAFAEHRLDGIGLVLKCRPPDLSRSVLERLVGMGLVRIFLGIESSTAEGLASIGRRQQIGDSERALALCRELGVSVQFNLMVFHPEATPESMAADLAFLREHADCAFNVCRVLPYEGTPLQARLRASGRSLETARGTSYRVADPRIEAMASWVAHALGERCWGASALQEAAIGLDHLSAVLLRFYRGPQVASEVQRIRTWRRAVNLELVGQLETALARCRAGSEAAAVDDAMALELGRQARVITGRMLGLRHASPAGRQLQHLPRPSMALALALALAACVPTEDTRDTWQSEMAPDSGWGCYDGDGDGYCEDDDCDDSDASINPRASETCDGVDSNCDGVVDTDLMDAFWPDSDGDGFGTSEGEELSCERPTGYVPAGGRQDCDDSTAAVYPGAEETCDGLDNNCDDVVDEGCDTGGEDTGAR